MNKHLLKIKMFLSLVIIITILFNLRGMNVSATEKTFSEFVAQEQNSISEIYDTKSANGTHYFIETTTFSFTGTNTGNAFYVPTACEGRMIIGIKAEDMSTTDHVTISVCSQADSTIKYHTEDVPTQQAKLIIVNRMGAGWNYIRYVGGRSNIKYTVNISFYTWDY